MKVHPQILLILAALVALDSPAILAVTSAVQVKTTQEYDKKIMLDLTGGVDLDLLRITASSDETVVHGKLRVANSRTAIQFTGVGAFTEVLIQASYTAGLNLWVCDLWQANAGISATPTVGCRVHENTLTLWVQPAGAGVIVTSVWIELLSRRPLVFEELF